jgi:hypothetical protein
LLPQHAGGWWQDDAVVYDARLGLALLLNGMAFHCQSVMACVEIAVYIGSRRGGLMTAGTFFTR